MSLILTIATGSHLVQHVDLIVLTLVLLFDKAIAGLDLLSNQCESHQHFFTSGYTPTIPPNIQKVLKETNSHDFDTAQAALEKMRCFNTLSESQISSLLGMHHVPSRTKAQKKAYRSAYHKLYNMFLNLVDMVYQMPVTKEVMENMKHLKQAIEVFTGPQWIDSLSTIGPTHQPTSFSTPSCAPRDMTMYMLSSGASTSTAV
ncbi:hypothetical protein NLI96_g11083 [Meripilus lineatus]|uniref:Uncharacterized protein n=1 Tax=Meripilus lineatus TaxID=2056292 RepID=A0AAD5YDM0_9APHY|nr:hypothetical protein NLI96_g11083 [Physisporinus lineatus]